tara:strand:- start:533 stop:724 length:192 start_codon:yes stop_codon:yes gene_type:complete
MTNQEYYDQLKDEYLKLRDELVEIEKTFTAKKEEFLRLEGALGALDQVIKNPNQFEKTLDKSE